MKSPIIRMLLKPLPSARGLKGEDARSDIDRLLTVDGTTPVERDLVADYTCQLVGLFIPATFVIGIIIAVVTGDGGFVSRLAVAPVVFFLSSFAWLGRRTIYADSEKSRWQDFSAAGTPELYQPDRWSEKSIPRDSDFILPLIMTIVLTPWVSTWQVLAF